MTPRCAQALAKHVPPATLPRVLPFAVVKRIDPRLPNTWGHWWIELNDEESYGWWPDPCPMGWRGALLGSRGVLNGIGTTSGASSTRDAYHGDEPDHWFHPTLVLDKSDAEVCADVRAFAQRYRGGFRWQWWWLREPAENCRTFQDELFAATGLREEPEYLYTRGAGCPFMYPFRRVKWCTIDAIVRVLARPRRWSALGRRYRAADDGIELADAIGPAQDRRADDGRSLEDPKARARAKIRATASERADA